MMHLFTPSFLLSAVAATAISHRQTLAGSDVCEQIASSITGTVHYPLDLTGNFADAIEHWMSSSSQTPACVVEVATTQDISQVLAIVGSTRTPFAIKSGGHASNPGFSSTTGVHISLANIKQVTLSSDKSTVEIGLGNTWSEVYLALNGTGVNVVGGRVSGPGTGGFTLGGGFSWLTDQYGLTCDTVESYNLILPNGTFTSVNSTNEDLFFALKGGLNRFGVVSSIVYKTVPQSLVYGGLQVYAESDVPALLTATQTFQETNTDPKAQLIMTVNGGLIAGAILLLFYDGPTRPASFDPFNSITPIINTATSQSFYSFSQDSPTQIEAGNRGAFASLSTTNLTQTFINAVANESSFYGDLAILHSGILLSYDIEPLTNYGQHATDSAYPHADSPLPLNLYYSWSDSADDAYWRGIMQQSVDYLTTIAQAEGILHANVYPNYALSTYTGVQLYGATNAARLRTIQANYDPNSVMSLAGGFTF